MLRTIVCGVFLIPCLVRAEAELKSHLLLSYAGFGVHDVIVNAHNTFLFGSKIFKLGAYVGYEPMHSDTIDRSFGGALRWGDKDFFEIQAGYFERSFKYHQIDLKGQGYRTNLVLGRHLTDTVSLSLFVSGKRIDQGMDPRWIIDLLPFIGFRL